MEAVLQRNHPVLIVAPDCISEISWIQDMVDMYKSGTIMWAATKHETPLMESYSGLDVVDGAIIGRLDKSFIRSPIMIVDPEILRQFVSKNGGEDFYYKIIPKMEKENYLRIKRGEKSILDVFELKVPIVDYGTSERLQFLRDNLEQVLHPKNRVEYREQQQMYVFDKKINKVGVKVREKIHVDGSWHKAV